MRRTYQVAALLLAIGADTSLAQPRVDAARVPIELRAVEWLSDGARVLLFSAGFEHVLSRVTIQWIAPPEPGPTLRDLDPGCRDRNEQLRQLAACLRGSIFL